MLIKNLSISVVLVILAQQSNAQASARRFNFATAGLPGLPVNSILPTPQGPFYGFSYDLSSPVTKRLPLTVAGNCEVGKTYTIKNGADLLNHRTDLECIYNAGLIPKKVPEGAFYGSVLSAINTQLFNYLIEIIWQGKMVTKIPCGMNESDETYVGWNNIRGSPIFPFVARIEPIRLTLAPGEYDDGRDALLIDYTQDFRKECPNYRTFLQKYYGQAAVRRRTLIEVYPVNQILDALRFVGKQEDGGFIYLGKSYLMDFYRTDKQAATIAFWYIVNYDGAAAPNFQIGQSLPPSEISFKYMFPGPVDILFRLLPFDNLLTTPVRTIAKMLQGSVNTGRNGLLYAGELSRARGIGSIMANRRRFQDSFNYPKNNVRMMG